MNNSLKELRKNIGLTQAQVSDMVGISLRTYKNYENDEKKVGTIKYEYIVNALKDYSRIDETHGILNTEIITSKCGEIMREYDIDYAYLFGSYAKGSANETSDIDILISGGISGLRVYGLTEKLRNLTGKKIDMLDIQQINDNMELLDEILRFGVKIYDKGE